MPNLNLEQVEAQLKASRKRSKRRFLIFITLILAIWGATYFYTKGELTFFTKKIAVRDTIVVDQTAAINTRDQIIAEQAKLITLLEDSIVKVSSKIARPTATPVKNYEAERLAAQIRLREIERRKRDSILLSRREQYSKQYPLEIDQNVLKNIQADPKK